MKNENNSKNNKYAKEACENKKHHSLFLTCPTDAWCNMSQALERPRQYNWSEIVCGIHS